MEEEHYKYVKKKIEEGMLCDFFIDDISLARKETKNWLSLSEGHGWDWLCIVGVRVN